VVRSGATACLFVVSACLTGCSPPVQPDPLAPDRVARELVDLERGLGSLPAASEEQRSAALARLDAILAKEAQSLRARHLRARLRLAWGDPAGALADLDALEQSYGRDASTLELRGEALWQERRYGEALGLFQTCLSVEPSRTLAICRIGDALRLRDRKDEARRAYERVLELEPEHPGAKAGLAALAAAPQPQVQPKKPLPKPKEEPRQRGLRLARAGKHQAAIAPLVEALRATPRDQALLWALARCLRRTKRWERAERVLSALAVEARQDPQLLTRVGRALLALPRRSARERAERLAERAVAADAELAAAQHLLGRARARLDKPTAAEAFQQALTLSQSDPQVACDYGLHLARRGAFGAAIRVYRAGLQREPQHVALRTNLMVALFEDGQIQAGDELRLALAAEAKLPASVRRLLERYAPRAQ